MPTPHPPSSSPRALVLIIEDEPEIAEILQAYLARAELRTLHAADGHQGLALHATMKPDLVLLDVKMPKLDGWQVLSEIRHRGHTPVIMLTAMDQDIDKLMGLRFGADDYVVKPFNPAEVVARVEAVLRRSMNDTQPPPVLRLPPFEIDLEQHEASVQVNGVTHGLALTLTEFRLLTHLARAPKKVFTRGELLAACLPEGEALERTVDSHISKLRKKLDDLGIQGVPASIRGVGYRLWAAP
ncbi:response regulator [Halomonas sp. 707D4]|uniref:response regulator n=1 Tax=Halomonas sp. 707D4 TaxID=1904455 RepID=UPI00209E5EB3|nr:response regulator [Halomonas sp. 707D4]MCP1326756.1 response regulator [Halomonas sp. 707D4]